MPFNRLESDVCPDAFFQWNSLNYKKKPREKKCDVTKIQICEIVAGIG